MNLTFVFITSIENILLEKILHSSSQIIKKWMPSLEQKLVEGQTILSQCNCGWFWLTPDNTSSSLIGEVLEAQYAVIAFGNVGNVSNQNHAQIILDAFKSGGAIKVRELEGCFSAVVIDRFNHQFVMVGDIGGQRSLRYYTDGQILIASPHDTALVATGYVPVEFDYISACSIATVGWSLESKSLLKNVHNCHPAEYLVWSKGQIQHIADPILIPDQRISQSDYRQISRNLDCMIETAQANIEKDVVKNESKIRLELSAGIDSRTVLSLLLSVIDSSPIIIPICRGEINSLDVQIASQLAKMYGLEFSPTNLVPPTPEEFINECDLLAFATNGDGDSNRFIIKPQEGYSRDLVLQLHGNGGEIFRGYYYPRLPFLFRPFLSSANALQILINKTRINKLACWKFPDAVESVLARLNTVLDKLTRLSINGYDILDLYYFYERSGVWGAARERMTWKNLWSPFFSKKMIKLAYLMPSPIGDYAKIHQEALRRFASKAYWIRINGGRRLPFEERNFTSHSLGEVDSFYLSVIHHTKRVLNIGQFHNQTKQTKDITQLKIDYLAKLLMETVYELLMSEGSFALELFGKQGLESILHEHRAQVKNHLNLIGKLITMERWRILVSEIEMEAAKRL